MSKALALSFVIVFLIASASFLAIPVSAATFQENTWIKKAPMGLGRSNLGAVAVNGKIYAIGGLIVEDCNPNTANVYYETKKWIVNTTEEYNPDSNKWVFKSPMPTSRFNFAIAAYKGKIYCFGGITDVDKYDFTNVTEVYDPETNTWETKAPMPYASTGQANLLGNKIYVINGSLTHVYDPFTDSWTVKAPIPEKIPFLVSTVMGNKIYAVGYWQDLSNHITSKTLVYDPKADVWSSETPIAFNFRVKGIPWRGDWNSEAIGATSGVNAPMSLYVFFIQYVYHGPLPNLRFSPQNKSWSIASDEPTNRHEFAVVNLDDTLFVIGGYTEYYPAPDDSLSYVSPCAVTEQYIPEGYGNPDPSYLPPEVFITPQISLLSIINQQYNDSSIPLHVQVDKTVNWTSYSLDGQQNITFSGNIYLTDISNGLHNITVYAQDTFGNIGSSQTVSFTIAKPEPEFFPIVPVIAIAVVAVVVAAGLLVYHKRKLKKLSQETLTEIS